MDKATLLVKLRKLTDQIETLQAQRRLLAEALPCGRTEAGTLAVYKTRRKMGDRISMRLLRTHVDANTLRRCMVRRPCGGSIRFVSQLQRRTPRE